MNKIVTVSLTSEDGAYKITFEDDWITFSSEYAISDVVLPIEVFYQMWNSDEMINHMEAYHERRKSDSSLSTA